VLKINDEEFPRLLELLDNPSDLFGFTNLRIMATTRGGGGASLWSREGKIRTEHSGHPVARVADTIGAGDAFTAALAVGLLRHLPLPQINDRANRLAAYVCTQPGATPSIPSELREWT
jgi:fructokinase